MTLTDRERSLELCRLADELPNFCYVCPCPRRVRPTFKNEQKGFYCAYQKNVRLE